MAATAKPNHDNSTLWLNRLAEVIVRVGVNLAPGQRLLIAEPFELQGVSPDAAPLVDAITRASAAVGGGPVETIWGLPARLREAARTWPDASFAELLAHQTDRLVAAVGAGDALLFLESAHPRLLAGLLPARVAQLRERTRSLFARVAPRLVAAETQWCVAPAPTPDWAEAVYPDSGARERLPALWSDIAAACRLREDDPVTTWREHLAALDREREAWTARAKSVLRYRGPGTDLRLEPAVGHRWCTARLRSHGGREFVPNLPTEEIFTAPRADSAEGTLRVARPVVIDGQVVTGIELEFRRGEIIAAQAEDGAEALQHALEVDAGATRLGEIAWLPGRTTIGDSGRHFFHPLLDENALPHVAIGDSYQFTVDPGAAGNLNRSAIHLDLPVDAVLEWE